MRNLVIGAHVFAANAAGVVDGIAEADAAGLDVAWLTSGGVAPDPFAIFAAAAASGRAPRIAFGTSIVPTFPRHPLAMAQGAIAVDHFAPGRLRLGIGPSHKPTMEGSFGIPFERPLEHLREYITVLKALLQEGKVDFTGERMTAKAELAAPTGVKVMASALRTNGFRTCGELADGGISWMCPAVYIRDVAAPALREGAAKAGRPAPPLVMHQPIVVSEDRAAIQEAAQRQIGFYPRVPYYSQMLQDAGFPEAAEGRLGEAAVDALVISGTDDDVKARVRALPSFGANEMIAAIIRLPGDREAQARTLQVLGELARE